MQRGRGTGSSSKSSLWDLQQAGRIDQRVLYKLRRQSGWDFFWNTGTEHNTPLWKVYKQTVSCLCFHFLTVVIGIDLTRQNHLRIAIVARFQSLQTETHCT